MAYVIAEPCLDVKDRACVDVCPVDCIHPRADEDRGERMLYIHPDECIDCGACEPVCPVQAISAASNVPQRWKPYVEMNTDYYRLDRDAFAAKWGASLKGPPVRPRHPGSPRRPAARRPGGGLTARVVRPHQKNELFVRYRAAGRTRRVTSDRSGVRREVRR